MRQISHVALMAFTLALVGPNVWAQVKETTESASTVESPSRDAAALEKAFAEKLTGAALIGTFSIDGKPGAKTERYEIANAKKVAGNDWLIAARIKYGDKDVTVPVMVKVYWADDTPVISLTNLTIPGLGTFTSRVMFYGDRYAGTWQHDAVGGHMWGLIEKPKATEKSSSDPKALSIKEDPAKP